MEKETIKENLSLDVVVPSAKPCELDFLSMLQIEIPPGVSVRFLIVVDIPGYVAFEHTIDSSRQISVFVNDDNLGASGARNIGLEHCNADYVLFMDDDVTPIPNFLKEYLQAILTYPDSYGFIGVTEFPASINRFTAGILASDILTFFSIAKTRESFSWGTTSNLLLKRGVVDGQKFANCFPRKGGGEDVDFCLGLHNGELQEFRTVPSAVVMHKWWNSGERSYRRFFRWSFGDGRLPQIYPKLKYRNFPNLIEMFLLTLPWYAILVLMGIVGVMNLLSYLCLSLVVEFSSEILRVKILHRSMPTYSACEGAIIRLSNDLGRLVGNFSRGRILSIGERFDYFTTGESIRFERTMAFTKFILFVLVLCFTLFLLL